jgi:hypothetical protein
MKSFSRRLEQIEANLTATRYELLLEDGSHVYLERAADLNMLMAFIEAQAAASETGEPVATIDHPHLALFAASVPGKGEGTLAQTIRQWSRDYLRERQAS